MVNDQREASVYMTGGVVAVLATGGRVESQVGVDVVATFGRDGDGPVDVTHVVGDKGHAVVVVNVPRQVTWSMRKTRNIE